MIKLKSLFGLFTIKATRESFVDGFFRTGDVGYFDDDEFIHLVDRAKEIFKYYGNHVPLHNIISSLINLFVREYILITYWDAFADFSYRNRKHY